jgi:uncharacterized protein (TIGR03435 family)
MRRWLVLLLFAVPTLLNGQAPDQKPLAFEVASVKANTSGEPLRVQRDPGRYSARSISFKQLLMAAYRVQEFQIVGGPDWLESARFDVQATTTEGAPNAAGGFNLMLQHLLAERFRLTAHIEERALPIYELTVAKGGPKMRPADPTAPDTVRFMIGQIESSRMALNALIRSLSTTVRRPVIDHTGLSGSFAIKLQWSPGEGEVSPFGDITAADTAATQDRPSLSVAVEEQLGLKLGPAKGPVDVLVIDHVERPTPD